MVTAKSKPTKATRAKAATTLVVKPTGKTAVRVASRAPALVPAQPPEIKTPKAANTVKADKASVADKTKKPKLVRDSFTMPKAEYDIIEVLKHRSALAGHAVKKSEILRAGVKVLADLSAAAFKAAIDAVPRIKTGRRPKDPK
jgi:hypothetical protein